MACIKLYCLLFFAACCIYGDVSGNVQLRNVIRDHQKLWGKRTMTYALNTNYDDNQRLLVEQSMRNIEQAVNIGESTCFSFREKERNVEHGHYLYIIDSNNGVLSSVCYTEVVGKKSQSRQHLYLADDCFNKRDIVSLLVVTMGLYPEHRRPDRDQYIQVHMDNVQNVAKRLFNKTLAKDTDLLGLPYDFHSITHFGQYEYAKDTSRPTITSNVSGVSFGDRDVLSFYDVLKVQTLYQCTKGYTMIGHDVNRFEQTSNHSYYPQWHLSSEYLPEYMNTSCDKKSPYTLTVLNGATWKSTFPLPSGNFCVSVSICIASSSPDINSYIQLTTMEGLDISKLNRTQPSGHWQTFNRSFTSEQEWTMLLKAHIMWGGDVLALNNVIVTSGLCEMKKEPNL